MSQVKKMALKTVLTMCPPWGYPSLPIGIAYLDEYLRSRDRATQVVDLNLDLFLAADQADRRLWEPFNVLPWMEEGNFSVSAKPFTEMIASSVKRLLAASPDVVGFSTTEVNLRFTAETARQLRRELPSVRILVGGPGIFDAEQREAFADGVVDGFAIGEGEQTLLDYLESIEAKSAEPVAGLIVPGRDNYLDRELIKDLGDIPFPLFSSFAVDQYLKFDVLPILFSRGCFCRCNFCGDFPLWGRYRYRPAEQIVAEIRHHIEKFKIESFRLNDLAMNGKLSALEAVCDLIIDSGIKLSWGGNAVIRKMPQRLFDKIRRAGCSTFNVGLESGSDKVLKAMNKLTNAAASAEFLNNCANAKISVNTALIIGFPGEGQEEFEETRRFLWANRDKISSISPLCISFLKPLSPIAKQADEFGITPLPKYTWLSYIDKGGLDYPARFERFQQTRRFLADAGIKIDEDNVFGELPEVADYYRKRTIRQGGLIVVCVEGLLYVINDGRSLFGKQGLHFVHIQEGVQASNKDFTWTSERLGDQAIISRGTAMTGDGKELVLTWRIELLGGGLLRQTVEMTTEGKIGQIVVQIPLRDEDQPTRDLFGRVLNEKIGPAENGRENGRGLFVEHSGGGGYLLDTGRVGASPNEVFDRFLHRTDSDGIRYLVYMRELSRVRKPGLTHGVLDLDLRALSSQEAAGFFTAWTVASDKLRATLTGGSLRIFDQGRPLLGRRGLTLHLIGDDELATDRDFSWEFSQTDKQQITGIGTPTDPKHSGPVLRWRVEVVDQTVSQMVDLADDEQAQRVVAQIPLAVDDKLMADQFGRPLLTDDGPTGPATDARENGRAIMVSGPSGGGYLVDAGRIAEKPHESFDRFEITQDNDARYLSYQRLIDRSEQATGERRILDLDLRLLHSADGAPGKAFLQTRTLHLGRFALAFQDGFWTLVESVSGGARLIFAPAAALSMVVDGAPGIRAEKFRWALDPFPEPGELAFIGRSFSGLPFEIRQTVAAIDDGYLLRMGLRWLKQPGSSAPQVILRLNLPLPDKYQRISSPSGSYTDPDRGFANLLGDNLSAEGPGWPTIGINLAGNKTLVQKDQTPDNHDGGIGLLMAADASIEGNLMMSVHTGRYPVRLTEQYAWISVKLTPGQS